MILTLLSWVIIFLLSYMLGNAFIGIIGPDAYRKTSKTDMYVVCGLLVLNVYAQIYSIFSKVGCIAFVTAVLAAIACGIYLLHRMKKRNHLKQGMGQMELWKLCVCIIVIAYIGLWALKSPTFVDTYLYHAQAVRWIEEYGVVPGLGNLHNRFAYNSAFMPLQALFTFSWIYNPSLYSLNGFLCAFFLVYAVVTNKIFLKEEVGLSDLLKLIIPVYVYLNRNSISSPGSDMLAMLLVIYISAKWCECIENEENDIQSFGVLCLIAVWAISVKLSAATSIIFTLYPAVLLIKDKKCKIVIKDLVSGVIILLPWIIRNVIISGYLIYPYSSIDLFNVDWKMPKSLVEYDQMEIVVWGRGVKDVSKYHESISQWFGTWYSSQMSIYRIFIIIGIIATIGLILFLGISILGKIGKRNYTREILSKPQEMLLVLNIVLGIVFWIFSAPLLRYGMVYLLMPAAVILYILKECIGNDRFIKTAIITSVAVGSVFLLYKDDDFRLIEPQGYWYMDTEVIDWHGFEIFVPTGVTGERLTGYEVFPGVTEESILKGIEPRGEGIKDGFRTKNGNSRGNG